MHSHMRQIGAKNDICSVCRNSSNGISRIDIFHVNDRPILLSILSQSLGQILANISMFHMPSSIFFI